MKIENTGTENEENHFVFLLQLFQLLQTKNN